LRNAEVNDFRISLRSNTGLLFSIPVLFNAPFFLSGGLKIIYDLLLYREFRALKPPEENL
jgi:hypothetical protein